MDLSPWQFGSSQAGARSQLQEVLYKVGFAPFRDANFRLRRLFCSRSD